MNIGGLRIWNEKWRPTGERLQLPHPDYPTQRHTVHVYEAGDQTQPLTFAAGELSNGVWGFYVPTS